MFKVLCQTNVQYSHDNLGTQVTSFVLKLSQYSLSNAYYIGSTVVLAVTRAVGNENYCQILEVPK
jgi:hypothetical protein